MELTNNRDSFLKERMFFLFRITFAAVMTTLVLMFLSTLISAEEEQIKPKIVDINTSPAPIINQWVTLPPKSSGQLVIQVKANNTEKVRFWLVPAKDKAWKKSWEHRKLINEDNNGNDGWTSIFYYGQENLITFIVVEAISKDEISDLSSFYVIYKK